jgi:multimeric flavodoxin WrbA
MVDRFTARFSGGVDVVNLAEIDIKGGCLGCLRCGPKNQCTYSGRDGYIDMFNQRVRPADIIVFAGEIRDRYLSSLWKLFFDRSFFNTHQFVLQEKQFGFLVSGPLSQTAHLREILGVYVEMNRSNPVGFVSDEGADSGLLDGAIDDLAEQLVENSVRAYVRPPSFLAVAGMKIFRDDVWENLRVVFKADHRFYRKTGVYDFPQRKMFKMMCIRIASAATSIPFVRKRMMENMRDFMLTPYRRVLES